MGGKVVSGVRDERAVDVASSEDDVWAAYAHALLLASSVEDVTSALTQSLLRLGYPVASCRVVRAEAPAGWSIPITEDGWSLVMEPTDAASILDVPHAYVELALTALERLLRDEERRDLFFEALDTLGSLAQAEDILNVLASTLVSLFAIPHVRVFRYAPGRGGLELVGVSDEAPSRLQRGRVFRPEHLPTLWGALENGQATVVPVRSDGEWVQQGIVPSTTPYVGVVPFWISTREMGAVVIALENEREQVWTRPFFQALLHHTAMAVERTEVFEELLLARKEADLLLDKTFTAIVLLSPDYHVKRVNPAAATLLGVSPDQMLGRPVSDLMGPRILSLFQQEEYKEVLEWRVVCPNGQERDVLLGITPLPRDQAGEFGGYLLNMVDISERKRLERLREQMLANVSHELRTPIAVIRGYAELLQDMGQAVDPTFMREALNSIVQRADELLFMVELYLDMANLESGEYVLRPEAVAVRSVIHHVWHILTRRGTSAHLSVDIGADVEYIWVDAHLFQKIIHHLLSNAIKFTVSGGMVSVRVTREGDSVRLEVSDEGEGIPPSDVPYVFEKFFRGQNAGYGISGMGMGLAFVRVAVEYMGGTVSVRSGEGGTTFTVTLPGAGVR